MLEFTVSRVNFAVFETQEICRIFRPLHESFIPGLCEVDEAFVITEIHVAKFRVPVEAESVQITAVGRAGRDLLASVRVPLPAAAGPVPACWEIV